MRKPGTRIILLVSLGIALIVLLLWLPRQPASAREKAAAPSDPDSLKLAMAVEMVNGENPMEGIMMLRELVEKDSTNVEAQYWLGVFAIKSGQLDKAVQRFQTVLRLRPDYLAACIDLGGAYLQKQELDQALVYFRRGIEIDSTNNYALLFAAQTLEKKEQLAEARLYYQQLLRHNTDTVVTRRVQEFIENINTKLNP
ncbi:MAG: tetratricopeptide repeat protein [Flavobacteriales bacterium]|jgi:Tfp pilus assembly protein PilF